MQRVAANQLTGLKTYFTEADPASQELHAVGQADLLLKLKAWLLLSDRIIVAGSHILASPMTAAILQRWPRLLETNAVIPYFRAECRDFTEYLKPKYEENDPTFLAHEPDSLRPVAEFLNGHAHNVIPWAPASPTESYRATLVRDLQDPKSLLRSKLIGVSKESMLSLIRDIGEAPFISRGAVSDLASGYLGRKKNVLARHSSRKGTFLISGGPDHRRGQRRR